MDKHNDDLRKSGWNLPGLDQVGYVVSDLDHAVRLYDPIFGPFTTLETRLQGVSYRNRPCDCTLKIAFGRAGDVEIEFIEPVEGESPHADFLAAGCEGMHHVRFRVEDLLVEIDTAESFGYRTVWQHEMPGAAFAYLEHAEQKGVLIELLQMETR